METKISSVRLIDANKFRNFLQVLSDAGAPYEYVIEILDKETYVL